MMGNDGDSRLGKALAELGYSDSKPSHHRSNLLHAIQLFAGLNHDDWLEQACEARLNMIRAENRTSIEPRN